MQINQTEFLNFLQYSAHSAVQLQNSFSRSATDFICDAMRHPARKMRTGFCGVVALIVFCLVAPISSTQAAPATFPLERGEVVMTGFSGSNPDGFNVTVIDVRNPGAQPLGQNWVAPMFHNEFPVTANTWKGANLGEIFGVCLDTNEHPNIYVAATVIYGNTPPAVPGRVYKLDGITGAISPFVTLPSGPASLGNICFDAAHNQFFVSDLETGLIYRIDSTGVLQSPTYDHGVTGRPNESLAVIPDSGTGGLTAAGRRIWGVQVYNDRLYYSVWNDDVNNPNGALANEIWSIGINPDGSFNVSSGGSKLEISLPTLPGRFASSPVSDITFSTTGRMLLAERTAFAQGAIYASYAHDSRVLEYRLAGTSWVASANTYFVGDLVSTYSEPYNSAGGADYDCNGAVFASGDGLTYDFPNSNFIYGLQVIPAGGNTVPTRISISYLIDLDGNTVSADKAASGDVAVYREVCECVPHCGVNKVVECGSAWTFDAPVSSSCTNYSVSFVTVTNGTCPIEITRTWTLVDFSGYTNTCSQTVTVGPPLTFFSVTRNSDHASSYSSPYGHGSISVTLPFLGNVGHHFTAFSSRFPILFPNANNGWASDVQTFPIRGYGGSSGVNFTITIDLSQYNNLLPGLIFGLYNIREGNAYSMTAFDSTNAQISPPFTWNLLGNDDDALHPQASTHVVLNQVTGSFSTPFYQSGFESDAAFWQIPSGTAKIEIAVTVPGNVSDDVGLYFADFAPASLILTCASNKTVQCGTAWDFDLPTTTNSCGGTNVTFSILTTVTNAVCPLSVTRTWQGSDACGNSASCSQTVTVLPSLNIPNSPAVISGPIYNPANGHVYYLLSENTWTASEAEAVALGGHLATVRNVAEDNWIYTNFSQFGGANRGLWIGLYNPIGQNSGGSFGWVSGEPFGVGLYDNWAPNEPVNQTGADDYVHMFWPGDTAGRQSQWNDQFDIIGSVSTGVPINGVVEVSNFPPPLTCATNKTVECGTVWNFDAPTATEGCSGANVSIVVSGTVTNATSACQTVITRTWTATDACTNTNTCSQTVTVVDTTPPVITCAADKTVPCGTAWDFDSPTVTDNCSGATVTVLGTVTNGMLVTRTWRATDACDNTATCSQTVTVDASPIVVTCATNKTVLCGTAWDFDAPTAIDSCGGTNVTFAISSTETNSFCPLRITRIWHAIGASNTCSQTVTVLPSLNIPNSLAVLSGPIYNPANGHVYYLLNENTWTASETEAVALGGHLATVRSLAENNWIFAQFSQFGGVNRGLWIGLRDPDGQLSGAPFGWVSGENWTYSNWAPNEPVNQSGADDYVHLFWPNDTAGRASLWNDQFEIIGSDFGIPINGVVEVSNFPPPFTCATNKTVPCGVAWDFDPPTATEGCSGNNVTLTILSTVTNASPLSCQSVATRTWKATDACGNTNTCSQSVTMTDNTPPVITCATNKTVPCGSVWSFDAPTATDNCSGTNVTIAITSTVTNFTPGACQTVITRTWTATDACGKTNTCSQSVTVMNPNVPTIVCPTNIVVTSCVATQLFYTATAMDGCNSNLTITYTPSSGTSFLPGTTNTVSCVVSNCAGTANCSFTVTVLCATNAPCVEPVEFVVNGSFELVSPVMSANSYNNSLDPTTGVPGWTTDPARYLEIWCNTVGGIPASHGTNHMEINAQSSDQIVSQLVTNLSTNCAVDFCFDYTGRFGIVSNTPNNDFTVTIKSGATSFTVALNPTNYSAGGWVRFCTTFVPGSSSVLIEFRGRPHYSDGSIFTEGGAHIDNVSLKQCCIPAPCFTVICPTNKTVDCGTNWQFDLPVAMSCCSTNVAITSTGFETNGVCPKTITQTWNINDGCGNSNTCSQTVTLRDIEAPVIDCPKNIIMVALDKNCQLEIPTIQPFASDNCTPRAQLVYSQNPAPGTIVAGPCQTVTVTVRDACDNLSRCEVRVCGRDMTPPTLNCLETLTITNCIVPDLMVLMGASDDCSSSNRLTYTQNPIPGSPIAAGGNQVSVTVTDEAGNSSTCITHLINSGPQSFLDVMFNTGVDSAKAVVAGGSVDSHFTLGPVPTGTPTGSGNYNVPNAIVAPNSVWGLPLYTASKWIGPGVIDPYFIVFPYPPGNYTYTNQFVLPVGANPATASISGRWAADNGGTMYLNGLAPANQVSFIPTSNGYSYWTYFTASHTANTAFLPYPAVNKLYFVVTNTGGALTSLRVEFRNAVVNCSTCTPPVILYTTPSKVAARNSTATFSVNASGTPALTYQWYHNGVPLSNGGHYSGVNTATLSVGPLDNVDGGTYYVVVTNPCGQTTSPTRKLIVFKKIKDHWSKWDFIVGRPLVATFGPDLVIEGTNHFGVSSGTTLDFGLPNLGGKPANVLYVPPLPRDTFIKMPFNAPEGSNSVKNYTFIMDFYAPLHSTVSFTKLLEIQESRSGGGVAAAGAAAAGAGAAAGVRVEGSVGGTPFNLNSSVSLRQGAWNRMAMTVESDCCPADTDGDGTALTIKLYLNSKLAGTVAPNGTMLGTSALALNPDSLVTFMSSTDGTEGEVYVSSVQFHTVAMTPEMIAALGDTTSGPIPTSDSLIVGASPVLTISRTATAGGPGINISWTGDGFVLQETSDLSRGEWKESFLPFTQMEVDGEMVTTARANPMMQGPDKFYRLIFKP